MSDPIDYTARIRDFENHTSATDKRRALVLALCLLAGACGSDDSGDPSPGSAPLEAPALAAVVAMAGVLHVSWTNHQHDCDAIEGERKSGGGPFIQVFVVPGSVDNEMDGTATDPSVLYTYRVRCKRGAEYSPYSNKLSGTP
jgi:hypothetical protein